MNGIDLVVDTNILINLAEGKSGLNHYLDGNRLFVSTITEIEVLGWHRITEAEKRFFKSLLSECKLVTLSMEVKNLTIDLKQRHKMKVPDAIIAATALYLDLPLLSYDSGFERVKNLNLLLLN